MASATSRSRHGSARRWLARLSIAAIVGASLGAGGGIMTVRKLEPGRPNGVDSLQVMLDSLARGRIAPKVVEAPATAPAAAESAVVADTTAGDSTVSDSTAALSGIRIPEIIGLDEGRARAALLAVGLAVGGVQFQGSAQPAGTVLGSMPAVGVPVAPGLAVTLFLSDGRPPVDTLSRPVTSPPA
jgi:hypothetical protein